MDQQTPTSQCSHSKCVVVSIATLIVGGIIGMSAGSYLPRGVVADRYQEGFDAAKKLVLDSPAGGMFKTPDDMRNVSGTVTAINGNKITLHTQFVNPFADQALADRTIIIIPSTKISKLTPKDPKVQQAEMEVFIKKIQSGTPDKTAKTPLQPPAPFVTTPGTIADIAKGNIINVIAGENIKASKEFNAGEIQVIQAQLAASLTQPSAARSVKK